jgi:hypothetical protein
METKKDYRHFHNYDEELTPSSDRDYSVILNRIMVGIAIGVGVLIVLFITCLILLIF